MRRSAVTILALLALVTAAWAYVCHRLQSDLFAILGDYQWQLTASEVTWGGWPLSAAVNLAGAEATTGGLTWRAERARAILSITHASQLRVEAAGSQSLAVAGLRPVPFTADRLDVLVDLSGTAPARLTLAGVQATVPQGPVRLEAAHARLFADGLQLEATRLDVPLLGLPLDQLALAASVAPLVPPAATQAASATAWRAAGGRVQISDGTVTSGSLAATFHATIDLDAQLQPEGAGEIEARGVPAWLDQLGRAGSLSAPGVTAAKAVIAILDVRSGDGPLVLPLTLQHGLVAVAGMPVLRMVPLAW